MYKMTMTYYAPHSFCNVHNNTKLRAYSYSMQYPYWQYTTLSQSYGMESQSKTTVFSEPARSAMSVTSDS